jgi:hypothetical protein
VPGVNVAGEATPSEGKQKENDWRQPVVITVIGSAAGAAVSAFLSIIIMRVPILILTVIIVIVVMIVGVVVALIRLNGIKGKIRWAFMIPLAVVTAAVLGVVVGRVTAHSGPAATPAKAAAAHPRTSRSATSVSRAANAPNSRPSFVSIASPIATINCPAQSPQCQFQVRGKTAAGPSSDLEIIVLVFPDNPGGGGWYIQWPPASIEPDGNWLQSPADIGSGTAPAHDHNTLQVEAILVHADATYNGTSLEDVSKSGTPIADYRQVTGLVGQSEPASITVNKL